MNERLQIHGIEQIPHPYNGWVAQRNGKMAEIISGINAYGGGMDASGSVTVATRPITYNEVPDIRHAFYGTVVSKLRHVSKHVLHPSLPGNEQPDSTFSQSIQDNHLVLPGISVSSQTDVVHAYRRLRKEYVVRAKRTDESDGNGQYELKSRRKARKLAAVLHNEISTEGLVLEAQIKNPKTISVGFATVGDSTYSFIAFQKDQKIATHDEALNKRVQRNRYQGADVIVVRGEIESLIELSEIDQHSKDAIKIALAFWKEYSIALAPDARRISFDYTYGQAKRRFGRSKRFLGGITDITARPGGTDPALLMAIKELQMKPELTHVRAEVVLDYERTIPLPHHAEVFIDDPKLRVFAYTTAKHGNFYFVKKGEEL